MYRQISGSTASRRFYASSTLACLPTGVGTCVVQVPVRGRIKQASTFAGEVLDGGLEHGVGGGGRNGRWRIPQERGLGEMLEVDSALCARWVKPHLMGLTR